MERSGIGRYGSRLPAANASAHASGSSPSIATVGGRSGLEPKSETLGSPPEGGCESPGTTAVEVGDPPYSARRSGSAALCADALSTKTSEKPSVATRKWARIAIEGVSLVIFTMVLG